MEQPPFYQENVRLTFYQNSALQSKQTKKKKMDRKYLTTLLC